LALLLSRFPGFPVEFTLVLYHDRLLLKEFIHLAGFRAVKFFRLTHQKCLEIAILGLEIILKLLHHDLTTLRSCYVVQPICSIQVFEGALLALLHNLPL